MTLSSNVCTTNVSNADFSNGGAAIHAEYGTTDANDASNAGPGGYSSDLQPRSDQIHSDNGIRPKTSAPDLGGWDFLQIRLGSGFVKVGLGMTSGVARNPSITNVITAAAPVDVLRQHGSLISSGGSIRSSPDRHYRLKLAVSIY